MFLPLIFLIFINIFQLFFVNTECLSAEGISYGRARLSAEVSLSETYSDNIFLNNKNKQNDLITNFSPSLKLDFALTPDNYISINYDGIFSYYKEANNFRKDKHKAGIKGSFATQKGSIFNIGAKTAIDSLQPYTLKEHSKDYYELQAYLEAILKLFSFTDIGIKYDYSSRDFNNSEDAINEFNVNSLSLNFSYNGFSTIYPVFDYIFVSQDNNDISGSSTDMKTHIFLGGIKWDPETRLSGFAKAGYYQTELENGMKSNGFALDTDITYKLTEIITLKLDGFRKLIRSTPAARESGDYYISTGGNFTIIYIIREPLSLNANLSYTKNSFHQKITTTTNNRKDNRLNTGINLKYIFNDLFSLMFSYKFSDNNSNIDTEDYKENRFDMKLIFSL